MSRWQRYWFAEGGRTALAIVRIAVALSVLLTLARLDAHTSPVTSQVYRPVGIWMLLGTSAPPAALVSTLWIVAWVMTAAMLLGIATRVTTALSFVSAVALASLSFAASQTWSHQYNVVFLAQLALLGARSGDTLSLDSLYRTRVKKQPALDVARGYQWSLRLVQLAVVLMFSGAAFHKLMHGHFTLRWALSDNLRHHLLVRFDLAGLDRPPFVDWILAESWRYRTAALLNMCAQASPLLAALFVRRPLVRAFGALMFLTETLLLGIVVGLWNLHWLPLVAVFIDWERLLRRPPPADAGTAPLPSRAIRTWIACFFAYDLLTAFVPTLDQRLNTFPFTSFPMFATIRAREPYSEHQPYSVVAGSYEAISEVPLDARAQRWLDHAHRTVWKTKSPDELRRRLATVLERAQWFYPNYHIKGLRLWLTVYEAPAYPAPAHFEEKRIAVIGDLGADGTFRTLVGSKLDLREENGFLELRPTNLELQAPSLACYPDDLPTPRPLAATLQGARFDLGYQDLSGNPIYFVVTTGGTPWLAASHETWRWQ